MKIAKTLNVTFLTLLAFLGQFHLEAQEERCLINGQLTGRYGTQQACEDAGGTWN